MKRVNTTIKEYQKEYMEERGINISKLLRDAIDDRMIEDGADPENWANTYGEDPTIRLHNE